MKVQLSAFEIDQALMDLACVEELADGTLQTESGRILTHEQWEKEWESMNLNKEQKVNNICELDDALDVDIESLKAKIEKLKKMVKSKENIQDRLRYKVIPTLLHGEKYKTKDGHGVRYVTNKKVVIPNVKDPSKLIPKEIAMALPEEFVKITYSAKVSEIKEAVKNGMDLSDILSVVDNVSVILK